MEELRGESEKEFENKPDEEPVESLTAPNEGGADAETPPSGDSESAGADEEIKSKFLAAGFTEEDIASMPEDVKEQLKTMPEDELAQIAEQRKKAKEEE